MTNLLVTTTNPDERAMLEEEFSQTENTFSVPVSESSTLEALFRAGSFQLFQNSPPLLAQKLMAFAENTVCRIFSLDLFREILQLTKNLQDRLALYKAYFQGMNQTLGEASYQNEKLSTQFDNCLSEENDRVFVLAQLGEMKATRHLESGDLQQFSDLIKKNHLPIELSQKTQLPSLGAINPQDQASVNETLQDNPSRIFFSAQSYYGSNQWWKHENHQNDSSKEISRFDYRVGTPLHQKSIGKLVIQELKYDLNREIEIGKDIKKHQEIEGGKYKKMMKEKLLSAKLKKRKKK